MSDSEAFLSATQRVFVGACLPQRLAEADAVILERIAFGAGQTNWFYARKGTALDRLERLFRPGSVVSFYFDDRIRAMPYDEAARAEIDRIATVDGEAVLGVLGDDQFTLSVDFPGGRCDLADFHADIPECACVYVGRVPGRDNDGVNAITITIPDDDGIVRDHPN